jgi:hypothetical protein
MCRRALPIGIAGRISNRKARATEPQQKTLAIQPNKQKPSRKVSNVTAPYAGPMNRGLLCAHLSLIWLAIVAVWVVYALVA